jgi:hypothetical protein
VGSGVRGHRGRQPRAGAGAAPSLGAADEDVARHRRGAHLR